MSNSRCGSQLVSESNLTCFFSLYNQYQLWVNLAHFLSWAFSLLGTHSMLGKIHFCWSKHFDRQILWLSAFIRPWLSSASSFLLRYNVYNAYVKVFGFPLAIAALQLGVGLLYAIPLWILGIRKMPKISFSDFMLLLPIGLSQDLPNYYRLELFQIYSQSQQLLFYLPTTLQRCWTRGVMLAL